MVDKVKIYSPNSVNFYLWNKCLPVLLVSGPLLAVADVVAAGLVEDEVFVVVGFLVVGFI